MSDSSIPSWDNNIPSSPPSSRPQLFADLIKSVDDVHSLPSPLDSPFSEHDVKTAATSLRKTTAPGPDSIPSSLLIKASPPLISALTNIFNFSWKNSVVPSEWKKADAFAIFKKGDRSDPSAYRLISITSVIMRLFERVVNTRLVSFLDTSNFFSPNQAGFRKNLCTLDNIYRLLRDSYSQLSKHKQLPIIFLDIIKAFDRVPHDLLLFKLFAYGGVCGKAWGWLRAFLQHRLFRVSQSGHFSDWHSATAGVPQGCVLSPLLFAVFINDLDSNINNLILSLFADDGAAWPEPARNQSYLTQFKVLRKFLAFVQSWSVEWCLDFSLPKTQILLVSNKRCHKKPSVPLTLHKHKIEFVDHYKYLGLTFQSNGRWNKQFASVVAKTKITANLISRINSRNLPPGPLVTASLVKYILIPQMAYALQYWRPTKSQYRTLNQIIATPLRRALGLHKTSSAIRTMWEFGIPDLQSTRLKCLLQSTSRALRSASNGHFLPSILSNDINSPNSSASSFYSRPFTHELSESESEYIYGMLKVAVS